MKYPSLASKSRVGIAAMQIEYNRAKMRALALAAALALLLVLFATVTASAAGPAFPKELELPLGFRPEGIATGRGTSFYVGSLAGAGIYKGDLRTGEGDVLPASVLGYSVAGLKVDVRTNYVFAAGTNSGAAHVFDGTTGELVQTYQLGLTQGTFINDIVIARDAAYFTDSMSSNIYRIPLGPGGSLPAPDEVDTITLGGEYEFVPGAFNANGVEASPNGKTLIVVNSSQGKLYTVDPSTGNAQLIDLGGGSVPNGDGILLQGRTLYVVQNRLNKIAVIELSVDLSSGTILRTIEDSLFRVPTTIARFGRSLYAVNARFGDPALPPLDYEAVKVTR